MTRRPWIFLAPIVLVTLVVPARPADDEEKKQLEKDLATLKAASLDTDTKALVSTVKKRTVSEETRGKVAALIKLLGAEEFDDREKAYEDLIEMGAAARPQLTAALKNPDLETRKRARKALDKIGSVATDADLLPALARVLVSRKPDGVAELLLNFLPSIEEAKTAEDVAVVLAQVAKDKNGKVDPALLAALEDKKYPIKRWAAGSALARGALKEQRDAVLKLLEDDNSGVRLHVAVALAEKDKEGVVALCKILATGSGEEIETAEEHLQAIADSQAEANEKLYDKAPKRPDQIDDAKAKKRWSQDWEGWWKEASAKVELSKVDFKGAGHSYILVGVNAYNNNKTRYTGRLLELDSKGKAKWELDDLMQPVYASKVRRDRVLVCEQGGNKVVEYDVKTKKAVWTKSLSGGQPVACERLPNGNTLIVTRNELMEVDRDGKSVKTVTRQSYDILTGGRHKNGTYTLITTNGTIYRYDSSMKETGNTVTNRYLTSPAKCAYLPNGGLVLPDYSMRKIREYDKDGKQVLEVDANYPMAVSKLPNGNYVYLSRINQQGMFEITKEGKSVSTMTIPISNNNNIRPTPLFMERK